MGGHEEQQMPNIGCRIHQLFLWIVTPWVDCPQPLDFSTQQKLLPFCAGVQFCSRSHRALIDRKKKNMKKQRAVNSLPPGGRFQFLELPTLQTTKISFHSALPEHSNSLLLLPLGNVQIFISFCLYCAFSPRS